MNLKLLQGDCLKLMKDIPDGSIDMILCDLPYGLTHCRWDKAIAFEPLWKQYKRIIRDNGAILLFSIQPFTTDLINSNRKMFRYEIVWEKTTVTGFLNANKMPLRAHENILVFYKKLPFYNPQKHKINIDRIGRKRLASETRSEQYGKYNKNIYEETGERYPTDVVRFSSWNGSLFGNNRNHIKHPTSKPVALLDYLIRTYTNEGETVLDNCMGSGSTGVACVNTNRDFIGFELDNDYFKIAEKRINESIENKNGGKLK